MTFWGVRNLSQLLATGFSKFSGWLVRKYETYSERVQALKRRYPDLRLDSTRAAMRRVQEGEESARRITAGERAPLRDIPRGAQIGPPDVIEVVAHLVSDFTQVDARGQTQTFQQHQDVTLNFPSVPNVNMVNQTVTEFYLGEPASGFHGSPGVRGAELTGFSIDISSIWRA